MNVTAGFEIGFGPLETWNNVTNMSFMDSGTFENYSTVPTLVDFGVNENSSTVHIDEFEVPVVVEFELRWLQPLAVLLDVLLVFFAVLMVMFMIGRRLVAHARMRFGRHFNVDFRLGEHRHVNDGVVPNRYARSGVDGERPGASLGRNVALRNFV